jgi:hypothetical protein
MLVFVTCVKHPENSQDYQKVWQMLNNSLFSICSQQDTDFRSIVVCDKQLPLLHHQELINRYTEFVEVDFPSHSEEVIAHFNSLGNLSPPLDDSTWWIRWKGQKDFMAANASEYFHIANVVLNMGTKLIIGILAAKKYDPDYVIFADADDYIGRDISAYVNSHPEENGWIMAHGYKMSGNRLAPVYNRNSICGTGNIYNFDMLMEFIGPGVSDKSTQNELFKHIDSEFLITIGKHQKTRSYFEGKGYPLLEYPSRSVVYLLWHDESSEYARKMMRGDKDLRLRNYRKYGEIVPINSASVHYFNILPTNSTKVFCLGFHQTDIMPEHWLQDMGYQVAPNDVIWETEICTMLEKRDLSGIKELSERFDAFQGTPWFLLYREFDRWFPGSKFILTIRDRQSWWTSISHDFEKQHLPIFKYIYGFENPMGHEKVFVKRFEQYHHEVIEYFKDRPDDLLVVDTREDGALQKISDYLCKGKSYSEKPQKEAALRSAVNNRKNNSKRQLQSIWRKIKQISAVPFLKTLTSSNSIIIGGCKESGAEFMLAVLSCHPNIHALRNLQLSYPTHHPLSRNQSLKSNQSNNKGTSSIDQNQLIMNLPDKPMLFSGRRWCGANHLSVLVYDRLLEYYGKKVCILNMVRDGRDVVTESDQQVMAKYSVECERWVHDAKIGMYFEDHPQVLTVRYEDLIQDYEATIGRVCAFIGEQNPAPFLNYPKNATIIVDQYWIGKWQQIQFSDRIEALLQTPGALECLQHYGYNQ